MDYMEEKIQMIIEKTGANSNENVAAEMVQLFEFAVMQRQRGWAIGALSPDHTNFIEVSTDLLNNVKRLS
jgi:hypothetical protein